MHLHYTDRHRLPAEVEQELGLTFHESAAAMVPRCDVVTINAPWHPETEGLFGDELIATMERGAYLIPPADHPWRTMLHHGMTPRISGSSISAQARYSAGTREILESWFTGSPIRDEYLIVDGGNLAGRGTDSYSANR